MIWAFTYNNDSAPSIYTSVPVIWDDILDAKKERDHLLVLLCLHGVRVVESLVGIRLES